MRPQILTLTGVGSTDPITVDYNQRDFQIGFGVVISGTVDYTVEHTFDNPNEVTPVYFPNTVTVNKTVNSDGNYAYPIRALRLTNNAGTTGTTTLTLLQAND